jgi:hypothetical protein
MKASVDQEIARNKRARGVILRDVYRHLLDKDPARLIEAEVEFSRLSREYLKLMETRHGDALAAFHVKR